LRKNLKRHDFSTALSLHLPQHTFRAEGQNRDLMAAIRIAFDEFIWQVDRIKRKLRGEHRWAAARPEVPF